MNLRDRNYSNTKKKLKKRTKHPRDAGNIKQSNNTHVISEKQVKGIFEEIMGKYLLKLRKDNKSQIKEAQRSPSSIKTKQTRHTIVKLLKTKDTEKILASREVLFFFFFLKRFIYLLRKDRACMGVGVGGAAEGDRILEQTPC